MTGRQRHHDEPLRPGALGPTDRLSRAASYRRFFGVLAGAAKGTAAALNLVPGHSRWPDQVNSWSDARGLGVPVVLIPGSFVPGQFYWHRIAPALIADGHPVFACNLPGVGTREVSTLAASVDRFLDDVRSATGSNLVILIGQSFGGVAVRHLLQDTKADVVAAIMIGSQNQGFRPLWAGLLQRPVGRQVMKRMCPAALQLVPNSPYLSALNSREKPTDVSITTVASSRDVFADSSSAKVAGASNIVLQELDPTSRTGHMTIGYDPATVALIREAVRSASIDAMLAASQPRLDG